MIFLFALLAGSLAFAADRPRSTDDQLRDSLDSKAGDDYDRELLGDPAKPDGKGRVDEEMQKKLQKQLGPAAQREDQPKDLLRQAAEAMREVPPRLDRRDSGAETQFLQRQIVSDLAKLIEQAKKSGCCCGKCSGGRKLAGGSQGKPSQKPGQPSEHSPAAVQKSDPSIRKPDEIRAEAAKKAREWMIQSFDAELQQHPRQQVIERPSEHFLPGYELEIEDYFRRLSEDQPDMGRP